MADISQLNFKVILEDTDFRSRVERDINLAKELNTTLSNALSIKGAVGEAVRTQKDLGKTIEDNAEKQNRVADAAKKTADETKKHADAVKSSNTALVDTHSLMRTISQLTGVAFGVVGIRRFVSELMNVTGQFEVQKMALTSMLQSAEVADDIFNTLRKNALQSPYTFQDLTKYAKQLTAFNIDADKLIETEKRLADVAAGLGVDMQRIILAYGQVKAAGVLKGTELRQFTEAGVPLLQSLAEQIKETEGHAISLAEVFARISKKEIPFEMVEEAFRRMTDEGGKFYNMQEVLVNTLQGKISKLRDVWQQSLYDIGTSQERFLKGGVDIITEIVANLDKLGKILPDIVAAWGAYAGVQAVVEAGSIKLAIANSKVMAGLKSIGKWIMTNPWAILAAAVAVATVEVVKFYNKSHEGQKRLAKGMKEIDEQMDAEKQHLDELKTKLEENAKGTKEWKEAKDEIVKTYGKYFNGLDEEITKVGTLETAYEELAAAVAQSVKERKVADFTQAEREIWENSNKANIENLRDILYDPKNKYTRADAYIITNELEKAVKDGKQWNDLRGDQRLMDAISRTKTRNIEARVRNIFSEVLKDNEKNRQEYLKNVTAIVKEYGLEGTEFDPNFTGPILPKKTTTPKNNNEWKPPKQLEDAKDEYEEIANEIDREINDIFERTLDDFDEEGRRMDKEFEERQKAIVNFAKFVGKAMSSEQIHGSGAELKLSKIIADKAKDDLAVVTEYTTHLNELKKQHSETSDEFKSGIAILDKWRKSMEAANEAEFAEKIREMADDIFKEGMSGYDLTDWAQKTVGQIRSIRDALLKLDVPENIKEMLSDDNLTLLESALESIVNSMLENTVGPEELKAIKREASYVVKEVTSLADALAEVSSTDFGDTIKGLSEVGQIANKALGAFKEFGGKQGGGAAYAMGWVAAVVALNAKVLQLAAVEEAQFKREQIARRDARSTGRLQDTETGSFFGTSTTSLIESRIRQIGRITDSMNEYRESANDLLLTTQHFNFWQKALGWMHPENWRSGKYLPDTQTSLSNLAEGLGMQLYDQYDNLNAVTLRAILESYEDIGEEERAWIERAIKDSEDYAEAIADVEDSLESVFGQIASDAAENIVDQWVEMGSAALDYADILDDVARRYAQMLVESAILNNVLNKEEADKVAKMFINGHADEAMAAIAGDMQKLTEMEPLFAQIMSIFDPYFNRSDTSGGGGGLGSGIKSITEDTANLLASYINAIRADVSFMRLMQEQGWESINLLGASVPTLNEHLAQVAVNTFNTAQATQSVLSELRSVIGAPGTSGMVVRVENY